MCSSYQLLVLGVFHAVLDGLIKALRSDQIPLAQASDQQLGQYLETVTRQILDQPQFTILTSSNRMAYLQRQLINTVRQIAFAIRNQSKLSAAEPKQTEVLFGNVGKEHGLKALDFQIDATHSVHVRGRLTVSTKFKWQIKVTWESSIISHPNINLIFKRLTMVSQCKC
ncbi:hypothetical protein RYX41_05515 [Lactiplantibacillus plantarum]|nr:hypothetical protein [Lactiplantibacillus plantarum]